MTKRDYTAIQKQALAEILKGLRENAGCSQQKIALALGISRSTYAYYELGKTTPNVFMLQQITEYFGVSMEEILQACHPVRIAS